MTAQLRTCPIWEFRGPSGIDAAEEPCSEREALERAESAALQPMPSKSTERARDGDGRCRAELMSLLEAPVENRCPSYRPQMQVSQHLPLALLVEECDTAVRREASSQHGWASQMGTQDTGG